MNDEGCKRVESDFLFCLFVMLSREKKSKEAKSSDHTRTVPKQMNCSFFHMDITRDTNSCSIYHVAPINSYISNSIRGIKKIKTEKKEIGRASDSVIIS